MAENRSQYGFNPAYTNPMPHPNYPYPPPPNEYPPTPPNEYPPPPAPNAYPPLPTNEYPPANAPPLHDLAYPTNYPTDLPPLPSHNNSTYPCLPPQFPPLPDQSNAQFRPIVPKPNDNYVAYYWVDTYARGGVPSTAIHGGVDIDGHQIYVGRAYHDGDWIPAKVIPGKNVAYISYGGEEHAKDRFQVLCEQRFDWQHARCGEIPPGAVEGGRTSEGESLYIGRVYHDGSQTVGKIHPSHRVCYIPFDGKEISYEDYEVLVLIS